MAVKHKQTKTPRKPATDGYAPPHLDTITFKEIRATPTIYNAVINQAMKTTAAFRAMSTNVGERNQTEFANILDNEVVNLTMKMLEIDSTYDYTVEEGVKALIKSFSGDENLAHVSKIWVPGMR